MQVEKLIARINELSRKQKSVGLSEEEIVERDKLRQQYLANFRRNFRNQLDSIKWADEEDRPSVKH
ncbi:DUF896 domain-containing protein [Paenibacillus cisolokensis]|uniref:UPF0291 protein PACILC2_17760 n=1 Tax=Paenibacillus cisolokensis TaxID=1658519 RepID=A0ABQ4N4R0_9BACL|nr:MULTISPECIES: DUF896 domain-containing protein [Paenibacillus]ALS27930.1 hypothetical protein IJ21_25340 [Paenibacillus sp. 32O-W]GIQ63208.1 hypothetical protein PACILC2_17760 [Paenibacillus cisolokensis]